MQKNNVGFTLIEILIALFIFTIVSMMMTSALHSIFSIQTATENQSKQFSELQTTLLFLSRDIEQIIDRPITNANGVIENAVIGSHSLITFTHAGVANPFGQLTRSTLQRTRYFLENDKLIRETWDVLDQTTKTLSNKRILFSGVETLQFEFLDSEKIFQNQWLNNSASGATLPCAIRVTLKLKQFGELKQLYIISGQSIATQTKK